jgi:Tfp pilus assembly PilM family ATPase
VLAETGLPQPAPGSPPPSDLQEVLAELTSNPLEEFCDELRRTISFLQTQSPDLAAGRMILMGDGAGLRNVELHLQGRLGMSVSPWQIPAADDGNRQPHHQSPQIFAAAAALSALAFQS